MPAPTTPPSRGTVIAQNINQLLIAKTKRCLMDLGMFNAIAQLIDSELVIPTTFSGPELIAAPSIEPPEGTSEFQSVPGLVHRTPESLQALRIALNGLFKRREGTKWSDKEETALKRVFPYYSDDLAALANYYSFDFPKDADYRRRDILTLLNNFTGEIDRAKSWLSKQAAPKATDYSKF